MRRLTKAKQLSYPSLGEIRRALRDSAELAGDELALKSGTTRERTISPAWLLNAYLCWIFSRPADERRALTIEGYRLLTERLGAAKEVPFNLSLEPPPPSVVREARPAGSAGGMDGQRPPGRQRKPRRNNNGAAVPR